MKAALATLLLLLPIWVIPSQEIIAVEVYGSPVLVTSSGSEPLLEGTSLPASGRLSLGAESEVTLRSGSREISLFRRGVYEVGELFTFRPLGRIAFEDLFAQRIREVIDASRRGEQTSPEALLAALIREEATRAPTELRRAVQALVGGSYEAAWSALEGYLENEPTQERDLSDLIRVLAAQSAYFLDRNLEAFRLLEAATAEPDHPHYPLYTLLRSQLLIESHAFADALETLSEFLQTPRGGHPELQTARLQTGVAYEGLGNLPVARTYYRRATSPDPTSPVARAARQLLQ